ncbi:hypothetical protein RESH_02411 [Rhodopirellula europaea SH398]|uniref:Uncharacterized protein n=1 Tax=Rhodopirellula europaea SH398 TaxID=1263868 RepID=M5SH22_9BACT|nr:hypothetical protein RESH_02411 [Rhodopirellula europaea SH398]
MLRKKRVVPITTRRVSKATPQSLLAIESKEASSTDSPSPKNRLQARSSSLPD